MKKIIIALMLLSCMLLISCRNVSPNASLQSIESITFTAIPSYGAYGEMITEEITVHSSGDVLRILKNDIGEITSDQSFTIEEDRVNELFNKFNKNKFSRWPDDLTTESCDGGWAYFTVVTEQDSFKKGGLNPDHEGFVKCVKALYECIEQ